MNDMTTIGVTTDMAYDLAQVVDLPNGDQERLHVVDHYGEIWADHVRRIAADWGYEVEVYWGRDGSEHAAVATRTPQDDESEPTVEDLIRQMAHDSYDVDQDDIVRIAGGGQPPFHPLAFLNTSIITVPGSYRCEQVTEKYARSLCISYATTSEIEPFLSAIGHEATAQAMSELLPTTVEVNRIAFEQQPGQEALVLKLKGRIPEGVVLDRAALDEIGFELWLLTREV